ncbi:MAG: P-II family nitrogen regulator [Nitrospirae bacterium]|jgi:nitrogen regulatory protein PII|nr:P-II family nitrogen regulator [Nitrospirota bacterium]
MSNTDKQNNTHLHLITCIVQRGKGDKVAKAAIDAGAGGATLFFARGTGTRQRLGLLGLAIVPEKEIILIVCKEDISSNIFDAVKKAGEMDIPGMGIAYITPILDIAGVFN